MKGLLVTRQIATARAFSEWLCEAQTKTIFENFLLYYPPSEPIVKKLNEPSQLIHQFEKPAEGFNFLLSGTSIEADEDALYFAWARQKNIPSIAFIDQWVNYKQRFSPTCLPDHIFVVDQRAADECRREVPGNYQVHQVGTPALNFISDFWQQHKANYKNQNNIYFATEPSSLAGGDAEYAATHGINDLESLKALIEYIENQQNETWNVYLYLHPVDHLQRVQAFISQFKGLKKTNLSITMQNKNEVLCSADLIVGMRSFFLLESGLLGIPTLSLQIGRKTESGVTDGKSCIHVATKMSDINLKLSRKPQAVKVSNHKWTETIKKIVLEADRGLL